MLVQCSTEPGEAAAAGKLVPFVDRKGPKHALRSEVCPDLQAKRALTQL